MQTHLIEKEAIRAKFSVVVPADEVRSAYSNMLRSLARQVKVPGFRPGKAPRGVLEAKIGKEALDHEVRDTLVETYYPKAVKELELTPAAVTQTNAGHPVEGEEYSFEVEVELFPHIELPDLSEIVLDTESRTVTDEMFEDAVAALKREHATLVPVERPVEPGDYLLVETAGAEGSTLPIDLERVGPELAEQFLGKSIGDEVELDMNRRADAEDAEEAGAQEEPVDTEDAQAAEAQPSPEAEEGAGAQAATNLKVVVKDVKAKDKPDTEELATTLGYDDWQTAESEIRKSLQAELDAEVFEERREEFIDKLVAQSEFDLPASLIERRKQSLLENLVADLRQRGLTLQDYLSTLDEKGTREDFDTELQETAGKGVKRDLVLERLLEVRGAEVSTEEFTAALRHLAQRQQMDLSRFRREMGDEWLTNYRFLMARDKAVRDSVKELVGEAEAEPAETAQASEDVEE